MGWMLFLFLLVHLDFFKLAPDLNLLEDLDDVLVAELVVRVDVAAEVPAEEDRILGDNCALSPQLVQPDFGYVLRVQSNSPDLSLGPKQSKAK